MSRIDADVVPFDGKGLKDYDPAVARDRGAGGPKPRDGSAVERADRQPRGSAVPGIRAEVGDPLAPGPQMAVRLGRLIEAISEGENVPAHVKDMEGLTVLREYHQMMCQIAGLTTGLVKE